MFSDHDEHFTVYLRRIIKRATCPVAVRERAVATFQCHEEAREFIRQRPRHRQDCIIRYVGDTGGSD